MNKKHYAFFLKKNRKKPKRSNPIAQTLKFFTSKRFKDKTKYTRKIKHGKLWKRGIR